MSGSRSLSSIYFLLNDEDDFGTDDKEQAASSTTPSTSSPPKHFDKAALSFITHPPPPPPAHTATEVKAEPPEESSTHPQALPATHGWVHSPLSTTPFGHPSGGPFAFLRARSLPTSSLWRGASTDHARQPTARDYHPRSTSWPESGGMAGPASSDSGLGQVLGSSSGAMPSPASTASFPTSPHVHSSHVSSIPSTWSYGVPVASNHSPIVTVPPIASPPSSARATSSPPGSAPTSTSSFSSSSFSSSPPAAAATSTPSAMSFHSLSAPTSPLSAVGRGTGRSPSPPLPSSPATAGRMPSPPPSSSLPSWSLAVGHPEPPQPAVGDVSYNKCLQLWTKQTEQRRSHQRVKRWQEFLHRTKTKEGDGGAETEQQQWIKSRPKRKHAKKPQQELQPEPDTNSPTENEGEETAEREAKERKRRRKAKDDYEGTPQMRRSEQPEQHREPEERRTTWDFHILQADDIRGQQEEEEHSARNSRAK